MNPSPPSVQRMLDDPQAPTAPLADFRKAWDHNYNLVWEIPLGHLVNLLEAACEELDACREGP